MISYAQNFEDVVLNRVFKNLDKGFYVDVGAHHPEIDSVTKYFYDKGWSGINIEPILKSFNLFLKERKRDININSAISNFSGTTTIYELPGTGLSSLLKPKLDNFFKYLKTSIAPVETSVKTLTEIFDFYKIDSIDFLKVDVEGSEFEVITGLDFNKFRPKVILLECITPIDFRNNEIIYGGNWKKIDASMKDVNYEFALFDGLNRFYCSKESPELLDNLSCPVNVTDTFLISTNHSITTRIIKKNKFFKLWD